MSEWQSVMAGVLDAGHDAIASHLTAASMWGVPGISPEPVHVSMIRVRRRRDPAAVRIHHLTLIPDEQRTLLHDIPVTAPAFTALTVFGAHGPGTGARVLDHLLASRAVTVEECQRIVDRMAKKGRNGIVAFRKALQIRTDGDMPAQSNNERRFAQLARQAGITTLRRQQDLGGHSWIGRVDFQDRALPELVIEVHSERYHTSSVHRQADARRIANLQAAGFTVVIAWDFEIWSTPDAVVDRLMRARRDLIHRRVAGHVSGRIAADSPDKRPSLVEIGPENVPIGS